MSEANNKNGEGVSDYRIVIDFIQDLKKNPINRNNASYKLNEGSKTLSSLLPKVSDSSLFEIDDLLYSGYNLNTVIESKAEYSDSTKTLIDSCSKTYVEVYCIAKFIYNVSNPVVDVTFLQIIEHLSEENSRNVLGRILRRTISLLKSRHLIRVAFVVKVLKVLVQLKKYRKAFEEELLDISNKLATSIYELIWMSKIRNIPQAKHPEKRRITAWLTHHTNIIFEKLDLNKVALNPEVREYLNAYNSLNENPYNYINIYAKSCHPYYGMSMYDHLYTYFMSAKDENQKYKRLECFLKALHQKRFDNELPYKQNLSEKQGFLVQMRKIVICFDNVLESATIYYENLGKLEKQHCHVEPYLSESIENSNHSLSSKGHNLNEEVGSDVMTENDVNAGEEQDLTIEKFLFYDDFLRRQHVVTILYTAFRKFGEILQEQDLEERHEREVFRDCNFFAIYMRGKLLQISDAPCWFENCIKTCPFLFFSRHQRYLIQDLCKVVRGEKIDEAQREELYFALYSVPRYRVRD